VVPFFGASEGRGLLAPVLPKDFFGALAASQETQKFRTFFCPAIFPSLSTANLKSFVHVPFQ
jgi:hypothetical protein